MLSPFLRTPQIQKLPLTAPTAVPDSLERIEAVLRRHGAIIFSEPTAGARLADLLGYYGRQRQVRSNPPSSGPKFDFAWQNIRDEGSSPSASFLTVANIYVRSHRSGERVMAPL
jgi:hypothetical protein